MSSTTATTSTHDKVEGSVHELKGGLKEKIGRMTNNPNLEDEGAGERVGGTVEKKIGQIKQIFEK